MFALFLAWGLAHAPDSTASKRTTVQCPDSVSIRNARVTVSTYPAIKNPAKAVAQVEDAIPLKLKVKRVSGHMGARLLINTEGKVERVQVAKTSGSKDLDDAMVKGAKNFEFYPAYQERTPVCVWLTFPIVYPMPKG